MVEKEEKNSVKNTCIGMDIEASSSSDTALLSDLSGDVPSMMTKSSESIISKRSKGGRPVGTTMKAKEERKINTFKAKNEIAKRFSAVLIMLRSHLQLSDSAFIESEKFVIM